MPTLSVNGLSAEYNLYYSNNEESYVIEFVSLSRGSGSIEYNASPSVSLTCDGRYICSDSTLTVTLKNPNRPKSNDPDILSQTLNLICSKFSQLNDVERKTVYDRDSSEDRYVVLELKVFGLVTRTLVTVPKLPTPSTTTSYSLVLSDVKFKRVHTFEKPEPYNGNSMSDWDKSNQSQYAPYYSTHSYTVNYRVVETYSSVDIILDTISHTYVNSMGNTQPLVTIKIDNSEYYSQRVSSGSNIAINNAIKTINKKRTVQKIPIEIIVTGENTTYRHWYTHRESGNNVYWDAHSETINEDYTKTKTKKISISKLTSVLNRYVDISSVNNGKTYIVNTEAYKKYGRIEAMVDFSDADTPEKLKEFADLYVNNMQFGDISINISLCDLHVLNPSFDSFELLDSIRCLSKEHGIDRELPISEILIPLDDPSQTQFTIGSKSGGSGLSSTVSENKSDFTRKLIYTTDIPYSIFKAQYDLSVRLSQEINGHISIIQENDISQALVISDNDDWANSEKMWKWDLNGLGFSNSTQAEMGYSSPSGTDNDGRWYRYGFTMDGKIVANLIQTGMLQDRDGINYWNLDTGEFKLGLNTSISGVTGVGTIGSALDNIESIEDNLRGRQNLLNGTYDFSQFFITTSEYSDPDVASSWKDSSWAILKGSSRDTARISTSKNGPYRNQLNSIMDPVSIVQDNIEVYSSQNYETYYTLSFEVKSNCSEYLDVAITKYRLSDETYAFSIKYQRFNKRYSNPSSSWRKYSLTFALSEDGEGYSSVLVGLKVKIGYKVLSGSSYDNRVFSIRNVMLNKGKTSRDWQLSSEDRYHSIRYTVDLVRSGDTAWTRQQFSLWNQSITQETIFNRLTNNGEVDAICLDRNGNIYINGSYMRSGTIDASIIKTGILSDTAQKNFWNMVNGTLVTNNATFNNGSFYGVLKTVPDNQNHDYPYVNIQNGRVSFHTYKKNNNKHYSNGLIMFSSPITWNNKNIVLDMTVQNRHKGMNIDGYLGPRVAYAKIATTYTRRNSTSSWVKKSTNVSFKTKNTVVGTNNNDKPISTRDNGLRTCLFNGKYVGFTGQVYVGCRRNSGKHSRYIVVLEYISGVLVKAFVDNNLKNIGVYGALHWDYRTGGRGTAWDNSGTSYGVYAKYTNKKKQLSKIYISANPRNDVRMGSWGLDTKFNLRISGNTAVGTSYSPHNSDRGDPIGD